MRIGNVKEFTSDQECIDYVLSKKYEQAYFRIIYQHDKYQVLCRGYNYFECYYLYQELTVIMPRIEAFHNFERMPRPQLALLKAAFGEISRELSSF